jgi:hypothetical protein
LPNSSTPPTPPSSISSGGTEVDWNRIDARGYPIVDGLDPALDDEGLPTNGDYLNALGFDPVEANRALLEAQQIYQILADPQQRTVFLREYDRMLEAQQSPPQRPVMPGGNAFYSASDPAQAFDQALRFGNPVDRLDQVTQVWGQVPAQFVIEQILGTFPDVD